MTPEEKRMRRLKKKTNVNRLSITRKKMDDHNIMRPDSEEEFLSLDFSSRCAVAGLQLGRTKVFLRREAFDRIESMRSSKFFISATKIQTMVRCYLQRQHYLTMKYAATVIQSVFRMKIASNQTLQILWNEAATMIQSTWRMHHTKHSVYWCYLEMKTAASRIQTCYRNYRIASSSSEEKEIENKAATAIQAFGRGVVTRARFLDGVYGIMKLQALHRGNTVRTAMSIEAEEEQQLPSQLAIVSTSPSGSQRSPRKLEVANSPFTGEMVAHTSELYRQIQAEQWAMVENLLDKNPELAEEIDGSSGELPLHTIARHKGAWTLLIDMVLVLYPKALIHKDRMGALPIHHAAAHDNLAALEIIYSAYKEGVNEVDIKGRLPIHVASEFDAVDAVKFLLTNAPDGAYTMVHRPPNNSGGGLPLHIACRSYASIGVITALLAENFASAKRADENGDLPIHLLLRCGEVVDQVVVKTLLTCFSSAVSRTDMNGDLSLSLALKNECKPAVINSIMMQFPQAAGILDGEGHSPLFLAFQHNADDRTILGLLNHSPEVSTTRPLTIWFLYIIYVLYANITVCTFLLFLQFIVGNCFG
jgi:ankyrin repeat protein